MHTETSESSESASEHGRKCFNTNTEKTCNQIQKCKFCSASFETVNEYLCHLESTHQNNKINSFMCNVCGKQYKTKNELTHHMNSKCGTIKQFKCKICDQELMSAGSLYNHMLRHKGVRSFMCRFCAKLFFTAGQLKVHERIHTQDKAYICEVCNKGFCHRQSLITHSTLHTGIRPYQCENCGSSFSCVGNLIKHRKTHADTCGLVPLTTHRVKHPSTKIKVKINTPANSRLKIREEYEIQKELETLKTELKKENVNEASTTVAEPLKEESTQNEENQNEKQDVKKEFSADNFDSSSDNENNYADSSDPLELEKEDVTIKDELSDCEEAPEKKEKIKRKPKDPEYEEMIAKFLEKTKFGEHGYADCKHCGKRYTNVRWFFKHMQDHKNNVRQDIKEQSVVVPAYKCSCCKMTFYTKDESLKHQQMNHAEILTCQDCEKMFASRDSLRSHQKVFHKGLTRKSYLYICDKCGKQFRQKSYLKIHEERNCDKGPFYECSICNKQFSSIYTRNNHMRVHDPEKKLLCKFCAKSFHWKGQLKIHERSHTGEKPFACLYCPKAFAYRESLITHSSIHTGIKPHLCEGCGSRFSCIGNLIKHRSSHASECGAWTYKSQTETIVS